MQEIRERILRLLNELYTGAYEREEAIGLAILSAVAGESIFLLGLPGVGKSMISRRLKMAFKDSTSFEYLMSRFSTPDEIFGPVSISKLKDGDTYERVIDGYLPSADIVFLDEIWKAGPAIQNSLLTALNEKIFRNGKEDLKLPLKAVISASNELPAEGEGLEALWDRFLVRYIVEPIRRKDKFLALFLGDTPDCQIPEELKITDMELREMKRQAEQIQIPTGVSDFIYDIREELNSAAERHKEGQDDEEDEIAPPYVSDRRWKKVGGMLRTSAFLNGRSIVNFSDCLLLEHLIWDKDEQIPALKELIAKMLVSQLAKQMKSWTMEDLESRFHRKAMGELVSRDNVHYEFSAGNERVFIRKEDYLSLDKNKKPITISDDNIISLVEKDTGLAVSCHKPGTITLNSFTYPMKRDTALQTGDMGSILNQVSVSAINVEKLFKKMVQENIFLRNYETYPYFEDAFKHIRRKIDKLDY